MNQFYSVDANEVAAVLLEVAHFLGYPYGKPPEDKVATLIESTICEMQKILRPKLVYEEFDCAVEDCHPELTCHPELVSGSLSKEMLNQVQHDSVIRIADFSIESNDLAKNLAGCKKVVMFAATIGSDVDKLIRKYQKIDTVKASVMQATGAMFIESFVDSFNEKIKREAQAGGMKAKPRFSPGYGDVGLEVQRIFFKYLNCAKIGLTLMDTLIMAPEKSVTAFIGIAEGDSK